METKVRLLMLYALSLTAVAGFVMLSCLHNKGKDSSGAANNVVLSAKMQETKTTVDTVHPPTPKETFQTYQNPDGSTFQLPRNAKKIVYQDGKFSHELPNNGEPFFVEFHLKQEKWGFPVPQQAMLFLQSMEKSSDRLSPFSAINAIKMCQKHSTKTSCHRYAAKILARAQNGVE